MWDLSVIILNWNAGDDTIACLRRICAWQQVRPTIWVVDNASGDGSPERIAAAFPMAHLIRNECNLGFAGGSNRGIEASLQRGDMPILLLNNDAQIEETAVVRLLRTLHENPSIGLLVPLLTDAETGKTISAGGKNPVRHHQTRVLGFAGDEPVQIVDTVSGTAVLIRADLFRQAGLLDEDFFFSTEVADLCLRARWYGYLSAVERRARAIHNVDRSSDLRHTLYTYYIARNRFIILRNHYRWNILLYAFWTLYTAALWLKLWLTGKRLTARAVGLALLDGLGGRFGGQNERVLG